MEFTTRKLPKRVKIDEVLSNRKINKITNLCRNGVCDAFPVFAFPEVLPQLRMNSQLCDGVVRCEDGQVFQIHRAILASVSPYFKALFTNSINRNHKELREANVCMPGDLFRTMLEYIYTGSCDINLSNARELLMYADQYQVMGIVESCSDFLLDEITLHNCLSLLIFAHQYYCKSLIENGELFIRQNFIELPKNTDDFYDVPVQHLEKILKHDELNIKSEETVFEAIKLWISYEDTRKVHLLDLLKTIRLGTLSYGEVMEISNWDLIQQDDECTAYFNDVLIVLSGLSDGQNVYHIDNYLFTPRVPYEIVFAVGGWTAGSPTNYIETYDIRADKWLFCCDLDLTPRAYHGLCSLDGLLYMIGGFDGHEYFNTVKCFDPVNHKWFNRSCMYYQRCYVSVAVHGGYIYAMGGYNGRTRMNTVEKYDPEKNQWELISAMRKQRSDASAATINDKIYIVGGFNGEEVMNSAEVYDTLTEQWYYIPYMNSARSGVSLVAHEETLYAIGGFDGFTRLSTVEKYTPNDTEGWTMISSMMTPRSNFAGVVLDNDIVVIGGFNDRFVSGSSTISYVEYYDQKLSKWLDAAAMNISRSALSACVLHGLPNARDYTYTRISSMYNPTEKDESEDSE